MTDEQGPRLKVVDRRWWARGEQTEGDADVARKPTQIETLEQQLATTAAQLQQLLGEHRRAQQEFDESRARLRREFAREAERGRRAILAPFLEVLDNLERALAAAPAGDTPRAGEPGGWPAPGSTRPQPGIEQWLQGVALVRDQFLATLQQFGVRGIDSLGQPFDAERHEAVSLAPVTDRAQDGVVVAVVKPGYVVGDELLRVASVVVGKYE